MEKYIGTKQLKATPMTLGDYNNMRGWVDKDGDQLAPGYLVEYQDGGKPNLPGYDGYVSWSPQDVFERSYRPFTGLTFGAALEAMKAGHKVARHGWNGKGMWIAYEAGSLSLSTGVLDVLPCIAMKTADNKMLRGWLASQTDMLAEDWTVVE